MAAQEHQAHSSCSLLDHAHLRVAISSSDRSTGYPELSGTYIPYIFISVARLHNHYLPVQTLVAFYLQCMQQNDSPSYSIVAVSALMMTVICLLQILYGRELVRWILISRIDDNIYAVIAGLRVYTINGRNWRLPSVVTMLGLVPAATNLVRRSVHRKYG